MAVVVRAVAQEQSPCMSLTVTLTCPVQCLVELKSISSSPLGKPQPGQAPQISIWG